jgi:hypothetical protein
MGKAFNTNDDYFDNTTDSLIIQSGTTGFTNDVLNNTTTLNPTDPAYQSIKV